jgi:MFS transporter, DHA1 family, multidrug resistance protein
MTRLERLIFATMLGLLGAMMPVSVDLVLPGLPAIGEAFGADAARVQLTFSAFILGVAAGQLVQGPLSDRFGRRPVMLCGVFLFVVAAVACALSGTILMLTLSRFVQGFAACTGQIVARAIIRDRYDRDEATRALANMMAVFGVMPIIGPVLGGQLTTAFGWPALFWFDAAFGAGLLLLTLWLLKESNTTPDRRALEPRRLAVNAAAILRNPVFRGYAMCQIFAFAGLFVFLAAVPAVMIGELGETPASFGIYLSLVMVGYVVGQIAVGRMVGHVSVDTLLRIGVLSGVAASLALLALSTAGVTATGPLMVPAFLWFVSLAFIQPPATAGAMSPFGATAGAAASVMGFLSFLAAAIAGFLAGVLVDGSMSALALGMVASAAAGAAAFFLAVRGRAARLGGAAP